MSSTPSEPKDAVSAYAGFLSRVTAQALLQPLDVVTTRWQLQLEAVKRSRAGGTYQSLGQTVHKISRDEGPRALWKGHVPCQVAPVVLSSVQFYTFERCGPPVRALLGQGGFGADFVCGGLSGVTAVLSCHPFDTLRTRLIGQSETNRVYSGLSHAVLQMWRLEGPRVFFQGLGSNMCMTVPQVASRCAFYKPLVSYMLDRLPPTDSAASWRADGLSGLAKAGVGAVLAGGLSILLFYPFEVIKTRQQARGFEAARILFGRVQDPSSSRTLVACAAFIWRNEGLRGFYKGLVPSMLKSSIIYPCGFLLLQFYHTAISSYT